MFRHMLRTDSPTGVQSSLRSKRASNITVTVGGVSQVFTYNSVINGFHYYWQGTPGSAFIAAMKKTGVTQDWKIS